MRQKLWTAALALFASFPSQGAAQVAAQEVTQAAIQEETLEARLGSQLKSSFQGQELIGLAAAYVDGDRIIEFTLGLADRGKKLPVTADTRFRWASISKPLTAIAAMQLVEAGQLLLDTDVREHVPEFPKKPWPITLRQLLQHRGGIVHYRNGPVIRTEGQDYGDDHPYRHTVLALDLFKESPLVAEPGTKHAYSTHGYMLAGAVVERAGKSPYRLQVQERIAAPLGMTTLVPDYQWESIEHRAVGYVRRGGVVTKSEDADVSWKLPGGGYLSTIGDLARFAQGIAQGKLLKETSWEEMWSPQAAPEAATGTVAYGLGFGLRRIEVGKRTVLRVSHSGSQAKTRTLLQVRPGSTRGLVLMTNSEWAQLAPIANELWAVVDAGAGH